MQPTSAQSIVSRYVEDYPSAASKKGLQVELVDDALKLGIKHAALNLNLCALVDPSDKPEGLPFDYEGKTYHFSAAYLESLDQKIKPLSDQGVLVSIILLTYQSNDQTVNRIMIHPGCVKDAPNRLGAFNTQSEEGLGWLAATTTFLAERWSRPDQEYGRVVNWIVGNEVNSHWWWSNMGRVTKEQFTQEYAKAVRIVHQSVRNQSSWGRVFISLEHHWGIRYPAGDDQQAIPGFEFLKQFAAIVREDGDFDWHIAYHPYPENLFEPRFWLDQSATNGLDTPRITFKNLAVLMEAIELPALQFHGANRRVILSEQGFHTPAGQDGQAVQAAAYCYAYRIVESIEGIDAFILHRHIDHADEGGLLLGLRGNQARAGEENPRKRIYDCFAAADTPQWKATFAFALPIIGIRDWP
jgi:hypothetical protein